MDVNPIGYLESCFSEKFGTPRQPGIAPGGLAKLKLREDLLPEKSLGHLDGFSHVWLIFVFHENNQKKFSPWISPPRLNGERRGLFSTRSPHRPNPIGLSAVRLLKIDKDTLYFEGVDLIDGTPILDIKPYIREYDSIPHSTSGWLENMTSSKIKVEFEQKFEESFKTLNISAVKNLLEEIRGPQEVTGVLNFLKETIRDILQEDPRPVAYKGSEKAPNPYGSEYGFNLYNFNVLFRFDGAEKVYVTGIEGER